MFGMKKRKKVMKEIVETFTTLAVGVHQLLEDREKDRQRITKLEAALDATQKKVGVNDSDDPNSLDAQMEQVWHNVFPTEPRFIGPATKNE